MEFLGSFRSRLGRLANQDRLPPSFLPGLGNRSQFPSQVGVDSSQWVVIANTTSIAPGAPSYAQDSIFNSDNFRALVVEILNLNQSVQATATVAFRRAGVNVASIATAVAMNPNPNFSGRVFLQTAKSIGATQQNQLFRLNGFMGSYFSYVNNIGANASEFPLTVSNTQSTTLTALDGVGVSVNGGNITSIAGFVVMGLPATLGAPILKLP